MRNGLWMLAALPALVAAGAAPAQASPQGDALGRCLIAKATSADKTLLIQWMFTALAASPKVAAMSRVSPEERGRFSKGAGQLMQRLLTVDCRPEAIATIKADGAGALAKSFETLGQVAMREFMIDPQVAVALGGLAQGADMGEIAKLLLEAQLP
ncbi:hypothetical protein [Sphingomonas sp.]|uniref:hypothetical protein n=1 Tax=Sphingomonas sp. TaxID=28214 RepID=UPI001B1217A4|nr:hypothetical protein [Sphingomonas sp.]MBO9714218.1 hypothetical protein [Sphingomonas sp.]